MTSSWATMLDWYSSAAVLSSPVTRQVRRSLSALPLTSVLPSEVNCRARTASPCASTSASCLPVARFQRRICRSSPPVAISVPSGETASANTAPPGVSTLAIRRPRPRSQTFHVLSEPAEIRVSAWPGTRTSALTASSWLPRIPASLPEVSHLLIARSAPPEVTSGSAPARIPAAQNRQRQARANAHRQGQKASIRPLLFKIAARSFRNSLRKRASRPLLASLPGSLPLEGRGELAICLDPAEVWLLHSYPYGDRDAERRPQRCQMRLRRSSPATRPRLPPLCYPDRNRADRARRPGPAPLASGPAYRARRRTPPTGAHRRYWAAQKRCWARSEGTGSPPGPACAPCYGSGTATAPPSSGPPGATCAASRRWSYGSCGGHWARTASPPYNCLPAGPTNGAPAPEWAPGACAPAGTATRLIPAPAGYR